MHKIEHVKKGFKFKSDVSLQTLNCGLSNMLIWIAIHRKCKIND